jgi:hypothetical protein
MAPRGQRNTSSTADNTPEGSNPPVEQQTGQDTGTTLAEKLEAAQRRITELEEEQRKKNELEALEARIRQLQGAVGVYTVHQREDGATPALYPVRRRAPKTRELPIYKGKTIKEHQIFFYQAELKWREDMDLTWITDAEKVTHCASSFEGTARDVWKRREQMIGVNNTSWEDFKTFMKDAIADPGNRSMQSLTAYEKAAQRPNQSVQSFVSYLDSLEEDLGYAGTPQSRDILLAKMREEIREEINRQGNASTDREELIAQAVRIENFMGLYSKKSVDYEGQRGHKRKAEEEGGRRDGNKRERSRSPRRDISRRRYDTAATGVNSIPTTTGNGRKEITCFKCQKVGHYATACPSQISCYNCGKPGHKSFSCPEPRRQSGNASAPQ